VYVVVSSSFSSLWLTAFRFTLFPKVPPPTAPTGCPLARPTCRRPASSPPLHGRCGPSRPRGPSPRASGRRRIVVRQLLDQVWLTSLVRLGPLRSSTAGRFTLQVSSTQFLSSMAMRESRPRSDNGVSRSSCHRRRPAPD
jgi:hypothetical protein